MIYDLAIDIERDAKRRLQIYRLSLSVLLFQYSKLFASAFIQPGHSYFVWFLRVSFSNYTESLIHSASISVYQLGASQRYARQE